MVNRMNCPDGYACERTAGPADGRYNNYNAEVGLIMFHGPVFPAVGVP